MTRAMRHLTTPYTRTALAFAAVTAFLLQGAPAFAWQDAKQDLPDAPSPSHQTSSGPAVGNALQLLNRRSNFFPDIARTQGPLNSLQKFKLFVGNSVSGHVLLGSVLSAGFGQALDSNPGYSQGAEGYAKRFGSSMARNATSNFFGTFLLPSVLHQDPRYFLLGSANPAETLQYALRRTVITRNDKGTGAFNWSGLLGPLASEGIANTYLPSGERTTGRTFRRYGIDLGFVIGGNLLREYYPAISEKLGFAKLTGPLISTPVTPSAQIGAEGSRSSVPVAARTDKHTKAQPEFGGTYNRLDLQQRRLVDDWFAHYNKRTQRNVSPEEGYNAVPISIRTTFEAVTNALKTTSLTSKQGDSLGNALSLIDTVETARGKVPRARGDRQFRIYVTLKADALVTIKSSREFSRGADNTVFHHSYPLNYRQTGGDPSIQISMSPDGGRADIDVDYRSSGFPAALFNGHLTADNSDVRAGDNYSGHLQRWQGLSNWWGNLFGVPVVHDSGFAPDPEQDISRSPRLTDKVPLAAAVNDFLSTWLVQGKPNLALAYLSASSYNCVTSRLAAGATDTTLALEEVKQDVGKPVPRKLWNDMEEVNYLLGQPDSLEQAVAPVELSEPALLPMSQKGASHFTLAKVPDDIAASLTCSTELSSTVPSRTYGKYYASVFRLRLPGEPDAPILLLWQKELGHWQIVARQIDPDVVRDGPVPQAQALEAQERAVAVKSAGVDTKADPEMLKRIDNFFDALVVNRDFDLTFSYFAPIAYPCVNLALGHGVKAAKSVQDDASYLRRDLREILERESKSRRLEDTIETYDPEDPTLTPIQHAHERAYMLARIPNAEATSFECGSTPPANDGVTGPEYATFFRFIESGGESAGLGLLWSKESGNWKITAFRLDEP